MMPHTRSLRIPVDRRGFLALGLGCCWLGGCSSPLIRGQSPDPDELMLDEVEERTRLVKDMANSYGLFGLKIEGIALVNGLPGTGSNPADDHRRRALIDEMQSHNIPSPQQLVASESTSLVLVQAVLPPAVQKGDRLDVQVRVPTNSQTTSLKGGWLMPTRLREMEMLDGAIRRGHVAGLAEGYIVVESTYKDGNAKVLETRGRVLGTAVSHMSRPVGLVISEEHQSVETAAIIGATINNRFQVTDRGRKSGVANPKRDSFVELTVPRVYKSNVERFMTVVRNLALRETAADRANRLRLLETKLLEPTTTAQAAIQLEAIGREGVATLKKGLTSPDAEVRFNSAEALAYLGVSDGAPQLGEAARNQVAFRWGALNALTVLDELADAKASDVLTELLHVASAETRYGAFRALRTRNPLDPYVKGEVLGDDVFSFHVVSTTGEPLVHFSLSQRPEMVVFGANVRLSPPPFLFVNKQILMKRIDDDRIRISRFEPGQEDQHHECSALLSELVPTLVKAGASYQDVMLAFRTAKKEGFLEARIALDAVPRPKRAYYRDDSLPQSTADEEGSDSAASGSSNRQADDPDIFQRDEERVAPIDFNREDEVKRSWTDVFGRMFGGGS